MRGATISSSASCLAMLVFQFVHPMRGATHRPCSTCANSQISIRAPHAGCNWTMSRSMRTRFRYFNSCTHTGCNLAEPTPSNTGNTFQFMHPIRGATTAIETAWGDLPFQLVHPMRGATSPSLYISSPFLYFNSCTPCGVQQYVALMTDLIWDFNSCTPCGVQRRNLPTMHYISNFNSCTPCGVQRGFLPFCSIRISISIHAPHEGCNTRENCLRLAFLDISIHAPYAGGQQHEQAKIFADNIFQLQTTKYNRLLKALFHNFNSYAFRQLFIRWNNNIVIFK